MKAQKYLRMIFMLLVLMSTLAFADNPTQKHKSFVFEEQNPTYLDTVVVVDCFKEPFYAISRDEDGIPVQKQIGDKYTLHLSNGLIYDKIIFYNFSIRDAEEKGMNSIYYVMKRDVLVVKVDYSHGYDIVVDIVRNMRFY